MFSRKNKEDLPRDTMESKNPLPASGQVEEQQPLFTWPYDVDRPGILTEEQKSRWVHQPCRFHLRGSLNVSYLRGCLLYSKSCIYACVKSLD